MFRTIRFAAPMSTLAGNAGTRSALSRVLRASSMAQVEDALSAMPEDVAASLKLGGASSSSSSSSSSSGGGGGDGAEQLDRETTAKLIVKLAKFAQRDTVDALFASYHAGSKDGGWSGTGESKGAVAKVYDAVLGMYCKANDAVRAESVLELRAKASVPPTTQMYNTLLYFYGVRKEMDTVAGLLAQMEAEGVPHSLTTYSIRIKTLLEADEPESAADVFDVMVEAGLHPNRHIYQTLISYFLKNHAFDKVDHLMAAMAEAGIKPNVVLYTDMIDTLLKANEYEEAKRVYSNMLAERVRPNVATFTAFIQAYLKADNIESASLMYQNMLDLGIKPTVRTHTAFLVYHTRKGDDAAAKDTLDTILQLRPTQLDRIVYTAIMQPLYRAGETDQARAVFDSMLANRVYPDARPYNMLTALYLKDGDLAAATEILDLMAAHKTPFKLWSLLFAEKSLLGAIDPAVLNAFVGTALAAERDYRLTNRDIRFVVRQLVHSGLVDQATHVFVNGQSFMGTPYAKSTYSYLRKHLAGAGAKLPPKSTLAAPDAEPVPFMG